MASVIFVNRLTNEQIEKFFQSQGIEFEQIEKYPQEDKVEIELIYSHSSKSRYAVTDLEMIDFNIDKIKNITTDDWRVFLRSIFEEEYISFLGYEDLPNDFINKITIEEVKKIFSFNNPIPIDNINEVDALLVGTRRFKITPQNTKQIYPEAEFTLYPYMQFGLEHFSSKSAEGRFLKWMTKKFGKEYVEYYSKLEQKMVEMDIAKYAEKRKARAILAKNFMDKVLLKEESKEAN